MAKNNHPNRRPCRPRDLLRAAAERHPGYWEWIDACRRDRGRGDLPTWPDWCFCPMTFTLSWLVDYHPGPSPNNDMGLLPALAAWRMGMGVYRFDPDLARALIATPISKLPVDVLFRMPEWCVYIQTPQGLAEEHGGLAGFFAHLEHDIATGVPELRLVLDFRSGDNLVAYPIHLSAETLDEAMEAVFARAEQVAAQYGIGAAERIASARQEAEGFARQIIAPCISLLLYICADEPDFAGSERPERPQPKRTKRGWRLFPASTPRWWDVGQGLGEQLRQTTGKQERGPLGERCKRRGFSRPLDPLVM